MIYERYDYRDESTRPKTLPKGCEAYSSTADAWSVERDSPDRWAHCLRRWPAQERRPTAYGLLTDEEKSELFLAAPGGGVEFMCREGWRELPSGTKALNAGTVYRVKPEPTVEIIVKVNGKLVDPCTLSKESWVALRKED